MTEEKVPQLTGEDGEFRQMRSKYEFVVAASREAERLNEYYRNHSIPVDAKVTSEALLRLRDGRSRAIYEEPKPVEEESRKESTYFFGP
jgi:hypothetical protein